MTTRSRSDKHRVSPQAFWRAFRHFGHHLERHRSKLVGAALCMIGATAMELLRPWPIKVVFDVILIPQPDPGVILQRISAFAGESQMLLAAVALAILVIAALGGLFGFGQAYLLSSVGQKVVAAIRHQLYSHIQRLSHSFHDESSTGDLLARLNGDVRLMRELLVNAIIYVTSRVLIVFGILTIMLLMDWQLTLVAMAILPLLALCVGRFGREIKGAAKRQRHKESEISHVMTERISAISLVQAYAREAYEEERFSKQNLSSAKAGLVATRLQANLDRLVQVVLAIGTAAVIWFGVTRVQAGVITPGDLLVFAAYLTGLYKPVRKLASLTGRIAKATACAERVMAILEIESEIADLPGAVSAPRFSGAIEFDAVRFAYKAGGPLLRDLSFEIEPGQTVALIGRSGAGKSTVANLVLRFYDPDDGAVRIDGEDIRSFTLASVRQQIAIVLQDSLLFNATIAENIAYGKLDASREEIIAAARAANAHDFIQELPDGYGTVVAERGASLSGGQRQRVAIARAIVRDAPILILDEPMTALDRISESAVREALTRLIHGKTCLLITHDPELAGTADKVLALGEGQVVEVATAQWSARPVQAELAV